MPHTPPLPHAAESPFPLHPEPVAATKPAEGPPKGAAVASTKPEGVTSGTMLAAGAVVGIGSAAIVAALMFTRRGKK